MHSRDVEDSFLPLVRKVAVIFLEEQFAFTTKPVPDQFPLGITEKFEPMVPGIQSCSHDAAMEMYVTVLVLLHPQISGKPILDTLMQRSTNGCLGATLTIHRCGDSAEALDPMRNL
jgi:hypothetical protein